MEMSSDPPAGAAVEGSDPDFRIATIALSQLVDLQQEAEAADWSARWSSESALTRQVGHGPIYLRPIMPERRDQAGAVLAYRCLVLFRGADRDRQPIVVTLDVGAESLRSLSTIETQTNAGRAAADMFALVVRLADVTPHDLD